jgi:DNA-binding transcriptional ArsR family regulator
MRPFSDEEIACIAARARVLAHPGRVRILNALADHDYTVARLAARVAMDVPALLEHVQVLFNAGLVRRRREPDGMTFSLETADLVSVCEVLGRLVQSHLK